jgi:predicted ATPase
MHISHIRVNGLHGLIDAKLEFQQSLAIIVGINGSGKTSILNLTAHLLRLNLRELIATTFKSVEVRGRHEGKSIVIAASKNKDTLSVRVKAVRKSIGELSIKIPSAELLYSDDRFTYDRWFRRVQVEISESKITQFLRANIKLTLVRLDRTLFAEDAAGNLSVDLPPGVRPRVRGEESRDPIARVQTATRDQYTRFQGQLKTLKEQLTNRIVLLLFSDPDIFGSRQRFIPLKDNELRDIERKIKASSFYPSDPRGQALISHYFAVTRKLASELSPPRRESDVWMHRTLRIARERIVTLRTLLEEFHKFDKESEKLYEKVRTYLDVINSFLRDSAKEAFFSEQDYSLGFRIRGEQITKGRRLNEMSSGEKQIVTMLTYLAFMADEKSIFVVDEPELSLHLAWQQGIVPALQKVCPPNCQLILATHSPEIVGGTRGQTVKLIPAYKVPSTNGQEEG